MRCCCTVVVGGADAGVDQTLVVQTGRGDGDHWGGQCLTAAQPLFTLETGKKHSLCCRQEEKLFCSYSLSFVQCLIIIIGFYFLTSYCYYSAF